MCVQGLAKRERLASRKQIGTLFSKSYSYGKNPLRIIWRLKDSVETDPGVKVLIAVPKRKVKLAVQRNRIKRIIREVYRCNKSEIIDLLKRENKECHLGILFVGGPMVKFETIDECLTELLKRFPIEYEKCIK